MLVMFGVTTFIFYYTPLWGLRLLDFGVYSLLTVRRDILVRDPGEAVLIMLIVKIGRFLLKVIVWDLSRRFSVDPLLSLLYRLCLG